MGIDASEIETPNEKAHLIRGDAFARVSAELTTWKTQTHVSCFAELDLESC